MVTVNEWMANCQNAVAMPSGVSGAASSRAVQCLLRRRLPLPLPLQLTDTNRRRCILMIQRRNATGSPYVSSISAIVLEAGRVRCCSVGWTDATPCSRTSRVLGFEWCITLAITRDETSKAAAIQPFPHFGGGKSTGSYVRFYVCTRACAPKLRG